MNPVHDSGRGDPEKKLPDVVNFSDDEEEKRGEASSSSPAAPQSNSIFGYIVIAAGIALFIRFFIATPYVVQGASMEPTFDQWQYLIVDKLVYDLSSPERGDVIVFTQPGDPGRSLIKRIIGLPGETVRISGSVVTITNEGNPKGFVIDEPYVSEANASRGDRLEVTLGSDEYFVLGDNRRVSSDSRIWGTLPLSDITGRVDARLFPFDTIRILPGQARYQ